MNNSDESSSSLSPTSKLQKSLNILICALIFGFGWHIRGSGTSDPSVVFLLFLLFIGYLYSPREKFNAVTFGLILLIFRIMRRGWGTFVGQVTGVLAGRDVYPGLPETEANYISYSISVPPWQGYFWLFIVGLAWAGLAATFIGIYFFSSKKYNYKNLLTILVIYFISYIAFLFVADLLIPIIAPDAYYQVYIALNLPRNFVSMRENLAFALAIIPVFTYIILSKKDYYIVKISLIIMLIFGFAFAIADLWQLYGRTHLELGLPFWSLWEYFSGFIIGGLIMLLFYLIPEERWQSSDTKFNFFPADTPSKKLFLFGIGHVALFLYGIQESLVGGINHTATALGADIDFGTVEGIIIILLIDIPLYYLYTKDKFGTKFKNKPIKEKCLILLVILIPFYYLCYAMQFIVVGTLFSLEIGYLATWLDTISVIVIEIFLIITLITFKRRRK